MAAKIYVVDGRSFERDRIKVKGRLNTIIGNDDTIIGDENNIKGNKHRIYGDNNTCIVNNSFIDGNGNTIIGKGNTIKGRGNKFDPECNNLPTDQEPQGRVLDESVTRKRTIESANSCSIMARLVGTGPPRTNTHIRTGPRPQPPSNTSAVVAVNIIIHSDEDSDGGVPEDARFMSEALAAIERNEGQKKTKKAKTEEKEEFWIPVPEAYNNEPDISDPAPPGSKPCSICLSRAIATTNLNCGHLCMCVTCAREVSKKAKPKCALCREPIDRIARAYF